MEESKADQIENPAGENYKGIGEKYLPPKNIRNDRLAYAIWNRTIKPLLESKKADTIDEPIMVNYCLAYAKALRMEKTLEIYGQVQTNSNTGLDSERPEANAARSAWKDVRSCADRLGLTPMSRKKMTGEGDGDDSFLDG